VDLVEHSTALGTGHILEDTHAELVDGECSVDERIGSSVPQHGPQNGLDSKIHERDAHPLPWIVLLLWYGQTLI
jgi:hypothetical protein